MKRDKRASRKPAAAPRGRALAASVIVLGVALLLASAGWALRSMHWPITVVRIDGDLVHTPGEAVEATVTRHTRGAGFFSLDLAALRADLEGLPWLRGASLRRIWPDTLDVIVDEHRPAAYWNEQALISARGEVFRPHNPPALDLPALSGPEGHGAEMLSRLRGMDRQLAGLELAVGGLHQDARRSWRVRLDNNIVLRLGRGDIEARLGRFRSVWPAVLARESARIEAVDLRYPNGFAVAWRDGPGETGTPREGGA